MSWGAWELWEVEDPRVAESWLLSSGPTRGAEAAALGGVWGLGKPDSTCLSSVPGQSEAHLDENCLFSTSPGPARLSVRSRPAEVTWSDLPLCLVRMSRVWARGHEG